MTTVVGLPTGDKKINLSQLGDEMGGLALGMHDGYVYTYDEIGFPTDFADDVAAQAKLDAHVGMRDKTDAELAAEFQATTDPARRQEIRDMQANLLPREQVPM